MIRFAAGAVIGLAIVTAAAYAWMCGIADWDVNAEW
jgi:hypothetical protein